MSKHSETLSDNSPFSNIPMPVNIILSLLFLALALCCFVPFLFVVVISFTDQSAILRNGYQFFPEKLSVEAYLRLFENSTSLLRSLIVSIIVTAAGTFVGLILNSIMGYVLSRRNFKLRSIYTYLVFIPMLFQGGLTASYLVNTQLLHLRNSIWALILPIAVSSFYIIVFRTFFTSTIPDALVESAKIDGASQLCVFFKIVFPISLPALATVSLFLSFGYWNNWQLAQLYMGANKNLWPMQYVLMRIENDIMFLANNPHLSDVTLSEMIRNLPPDGIRMALVVLTVLPIALIYPFFQKYFITGLTVGAVKG